MSQTRRLQAQPGLYSSDIERSFEFYEDRRMTRGTLTASGVFGVLFAILFTCMPPIANFQVPGASSLSMGDAMAQSEAGTVYRARLRAHWLPDGDRFWYRADSPGEERKFYIVDAAAGSREAAFDHLAVSRAFSTQLERPIDANNLPIDSISIREDGIVFSGREGRWSWNREAGTLSAGVTGEETEEGLPFDLDERPSRSAGTDTEITFVNRLEGAVRVYWIDGSGQRHLYMELTAGSERPQHTFAGHVWVAIDTEERLLAVFEATERPELAIISDRAPTRRTTTPKAKPAYVSPDRLWELFVHGDNLHARNTETLETHALSFDAVPSHSFRKDVQRARGMAMRYDEPDPPASMSDATIWSPDSRFVIALQTRAVPDRFFHIIEPSPENQFYPQLHAYPYFKPGDEIPTQTPRLFDVAAGREIAIPRETFPNPFDVSEFHWDLSSDRFLFLYNERGHQTLRVIEVTVGSGDAAEVSVLVDETSETFVDYAFKSFLYPLDESNELLWMSERDGWNHIYRLDRKRGHISQITEGNWAVRKVFRVDEDSRQIGFRAHGLAEDQDPYHAHFARIGFDGKNLVRLTEGDGTHRLEWSPDNRYYIDSYSRVDAPPRHELRRGETGELVLLLETADASDVLEKRKHWPERFVAPGRDGKTEIHGVIHRPADFDPSRRYPVIESIYAGPHGFHVPKEFRSRYRSVDNVLEAGFIVVQIDGMGTNWRSKAFHDVCWQNIGDAGFPDRIAWMKAAAETRPWMDLERVGIFGGSAGGQNAMRALIAHHDFYDVAVADCGCHDNRMDKIWWNEAWMGWPIGPHYSESSNVDQAHRLEGDLMLIVGGRDTNVDPASTTQVVDALVKADKDFDFVYIPGTGHGAAGTPYGTRRLVEFFIEHLQP